MTELDRFLYELQANPRWFSNIISTFTLEAKEADFSPFPDSMNPILILLCNQKGISQIFSHQAMAIANVISGKSIVLSTGVASGKSLCYQLPILNSILSIPTSRALMLFPTKALAQDQAKKMADFAADLSRLSKVKIHCGIYDGDTPSAERSRIRKQANILFTNPDMLHLGILPHHTMWSAFFQNLRYVVIDEVHYYRGVFGSHFANVIRRLKRICKIYGIKPVFICTSATLANARELASELVEESVILIDRDGSPKGKRINMILNPPMIDYHLGIRRSSMHEAASLAKLFLSFKVQALLFSVSRRSVEMILRLIKKHHPNQVASYRSGYLPHERRKIESDLREGNTQIVVTTNALELGIDIGGLDAVFINGYPGSISAVRQEAGRAGRKANTALSILIAGANPLDQYICHHPEYLWDNNPEHALIDPNNTEIMLKQLLCAVCELAMDATESFGGISSTELWGYLEILIDEGKIRKVGTKYVGVLNSYPAAEVSLRNAGEQYPIMAEEECIGFVDATSALWMTHPRAIYLHAAETWIVDNLDLENKVVQLSPIVADYYTQPLRTTRMNLLDIPKIHLETWGKKYFGKVKVINSITGFKKFRFGTMETLGQEDLDLPDQELNTCAWWMALSPQAVNEIREKGLWTNDPKDYGPRWPEISEAIRNRDNNRCVHCGTTDANRKLDVHHKKPLRFFEDISEANNPDNLVTLCPRCHHLAEQQVRIQSGLAGLAYLLSNLAPFFVMCDPTNLGVHSEPASPLADGNPIVALYDMIPGGIGLSKKLFDIQDKVLKAALEQVKNCPCLDGCPACVGPVAENGMGAKAEVVAILEQMGVVN